MKKIYIKLILIASLFTPFLIKTKSFNEILCFIKEAYKNIGKTGAIMPMSSLTSKNIANQIIQDFNNNINTNNNSKIKLLEVGAGTGNMSDHLIATLEKNNINFQIDLIEINSEFTNLLNKKFKNNKNVNIINANVLDFNPDGRYDYIVSTLPFNSIDFSVEEVKRIFDKFQNLAKYKGKIFWVEYAILGDIIKTFSNNKNKNNYIQKHKVIDEFKNMNHTKREFILLNVPPVYIYSTQNLKL